MTSPKASETRERLENASCTLFVDPGRRFTRTPRRPPGGPEENIDLATTIVPQNSGRGAIIAKICCKNRTKIAGIIFHGIDFPKKVFKM